MKRSSFLTRFPMVLAALVPLGIAAGHAGPLFPNQQFLNGVPTQQAVPADFDRDGRLDLAVSSSTGDLLIFIGLGDGTFSYGQLLGQGGPSIAVGDFNGDGFLDLAASGDALRVFSGRGDGTFGAATLIPTGASVVDLAGGNLNGDGSSDLIVAGLTGVSAALGHTDGTFTLQPIVSGQGYQHVALADFNHDGKLDLALARYVCCNVTTSFALMFLGHGDGTFGLTASFGAAGKPSSLAAGDLDGDGLDDVAIADFSPPGFGIDLFFSGGDGSFSRSSGLTQAGGWVSIADLDGDGLADLVTNSFGFLNAFLHTGARSFAPLPNQPGCSDFNAVGDFNGDGRKDVVLTGDDDTVYLGRGDGTFGDPRLQVGDIAYGVATADFNADGEADLVAAVPSVDNHLSVLLGRGGGRFEPAVDYPGANGVNTVRVGDFDGDGHVDLASTSSTGFLGQISVNFGNGNGTFLSAIGLDESGGYPLDLVARDLDGDGRSDLMVVNFDSNDISVVLGRADRGLGPQTRYAVGTGPRAVAAGDLDGDGRLDLVVANGRSNDLSILAGRGDGTF